MRETERGQRAEVKEEQTGAGIEELRPYLVLLKEESQEEWGMCTANSIPVASDPPPLT